jgi:hypothetical protein
VTALSPIMSGDDCCGFILRRGPGGVEAYDRDAHPIGIFQSEEKAAVTVIEAAKAEQSAG